MSLFGFVSGAAFGLFVEIYSNGIRKLPLFANPRNHVVAIGVGGSLGVALQSWQVEQRTLLAAELERLGKAPRAQ